MIDLYTRFAVPDFAAAAMESPAMKRIAGVEMNCGMSYTSFPLFTAGENYSRAQHSLNVSRLVYHFTDDPRQCLAGLFHDISTPVFSHVVDFLNGDHMTQESTEADTADMIRNDLEISRILSSLGLSADDVSDYHRFPIADNEMPGLSCDRLEYTLGNAVNYRFITPEEADRFMEDLCILQNENGISELGFCTEELALSFAETALRCGKVYSGREDRYSMEILARLLKDAIRDGILSRDDLYGTEAEVIEKLENSRVQTRWHAFRKLHKVYEVSPEEGICVNAKRRYVDPLIAGSGRASQADAVLRSKIRDFIEEDYSVFLKGC